MTGFVRDNVRNAALEALQRCDALCNATERLTGFVSDNVRNVLKTLLSPQRWEALQRWPRLHVRGTKTKAINANNGLVGEHAARSVNMVDVHFFVDT